MAFISGAGGGGGGKLAQLLAKPPVSTSVPYPHKGDAPVGVDARNAHVALQIWSALRPWFGNTPRPDVILRNAPGRQLQSSMVTYPTNPGGVPRVYTGALSGLSDPNTTMSRPTLIHEYAHVAQNLGFAGPHKNYPNQNARVPLSPQQQIAWQSTPLGHMLWNSNTNPYVEAGADTFKRLVASKVLGGLGFQHNAVHTNSSYDFQVKELQRLLGQKADQNWALYGQFNQPPTTSKPTLASLFTGRP